RPGAVALRGGCPPGGGRQVLDLEVALARRGQLDVAGWLVAVRDGVVLARLPGRDHGHGEAVAQRLRVAEADARASGPRPPHRIRHVRREYRAPPQLEGVHPEERLGDRKSVV